MAKQYLDTHGVDLLWDKIKTTFSNKKTTSDELTKLGKSITKLDGTVTENKKDAESKITSIDKKQSALSNEFYRVKDEVLETGEASDTFIHVEDSAMAEMQELEVDGVCEQETTTGKNLYDLTGDVIGHKLPQTLPAGTYTFSVYKKNVTSLRVRLSKTTDTSIDSVLSNLYKTTLDGQRLYLTLETTFEANYINISSNGGVTFPMLEIGATATEYEPYTGGQPSPSPDYPQEIKTIENSLKITSCNKNFFKMNDNYSKGYTTTKNGITLKVEDDLSITLKGTATNKTEFFLFGSWGIKNNRYIPKGIFTISQNGFVDGITSNLGFFKNGVNVQNKSLTYTNTTVTFNSSLTEFDGMSYSILIADGKTIDTRVYTQIERDTKVTFYMQHIQSQITANLPEGEFIGKIDENHKDTLKVEYNEEDGQYHLMLDKMVGMGDTSKYFGSVNRVTTIQNKYRFTFDINTDKIPISNIKPDVTYPLYCNKFIKGSRTKTYEEINSIAYGTSSYSYSQFVLYYSEIKDFTIAQFSDWLTNNPLIIYYILQKPYTLDLGVIDMPLSYDDITNVFTNSDLLPKINAKYYRNFTSTIQNLQVNNKALKQELVDINNRLDALESASVSVVSDEPIEESEVVEQ